MFRKFFVLVFLYFGAIFMLHASYDGNNQKGLKVISGHIRDAANGESLIGATLYIREPKAGTVSNSYGFYSISLAPGKYTLVYSFIGYDNVEKSIDLTNNTVIEIELQPETEKIQEVVIRAEKKNENLVRVEMGVETLQPKVIKSIPALIGEVDLVKAIQMLPGVQSTAEGGSGFSVRGGSTDQNLILLDEATVYNASHLMGFLSVFNNDAVSDLKLYKGDIPAQYGGRLASLLDVRMRDGNSKKFSGQGGIGIISSRLTLEGPIKKDRTSFLVAGRRTYLDLFLPLAAEKHVRNSKLYFYDANMKLNHRFNQNNRLFVSGYLGRDVVGMLDFRIAYGNKTFTARWNHIFSPRLFMNLTGVWSEYDYEMKNDNGTDSFRWTSHMHDLGLKADFSFFIKPEESLKFGVQSFYHIFDPGVVRGTSENSIIKDYFLEKSYALEHAGYVSFQHNIGSKLSLKYGVRASLFQNIGKTTVFHYDENHEVSDTLYYGSGEVYKNYFGLEPRVGLSYLISDDLSVKVNYNRTRQFIQQASNSAGGTFVDVWFSATPNVKPQVSDQVSAGIFKNFKEGVYQTSIEAYYKEMKNTIDFVDHAELLLNKQLEGELRFGSSKAYGIEFLVKKTEGKLTGWAGYTLSRAERTITGINDDKTYLAPYDKPHNITLVASYELNKRVTLSANWLYATGQPATLPVQRYEINGSMIPYYTERNASRYDDYHRLDLSLALKTRNKRNRPWSGEWVFSIYNAYNNKNTWALNFKQEIDNPYVIYAEKSYLFPILPSVTYNFKF